MFLLTHYNTYGLLKYLNVSYDIPRLYPMTKVTGISREEILKFEPQVARVSPADTIPYSTALIVSPQICDTAGEGSHITPIGSHLWDEWESTTNYHRPLIDL